MAASDVNAFLDRVSIDDDFARRLAEVNGDPAAVQRLLAAEGFDLDPATVREAFLDRFGDQLDEQQLAAIAGGLTQDQNMAIVSGVSFAGAGIAIGITAAAAAAA